MKLHTISLALLISACGDNSPAPPQIGLDAGFDEPGMGGRSALGGSGNAVNATNGGTLGASGDTGGADSDSGGGIGLTGDHADAGTSVGGNTEDGRNGGAGGGEKGGEPHGGAGGAAQDGKGGAVHDGKGGTAQGGKGGTTQDGKGGTPQGGKGGTPQGGKGGTAQDGKGGTAQGGRGGSGGSAAQGGNGGAAQGGEGGAPQGGNGGAAQGGEGGAPQGGNGGAAQGGEGGAPQGGNGGAAQGGEGGAAQGGEGGAAQGGEGGADGGADGADGGAEGVGLTGNRNDDGTSSDVCALRDGKVPFTTVTLEPDSGGADTRFGKGIGDISGDGKADVFLGSADGKGLNWYEFPAWGKRTIRATGTWSGEMRLADIDGDGDLDLVAGNITGLNWYENPRPDGDPRSDAWTEHLIGGDGTNISDLALGDLDGDGKIDVAVRYEKDANRPAAVFLQTGSGTVSWSAAFDANSTELGNEGLALGDIDGDGDLDVVLQRIWCENDGSGEAWTEHAYASGLTQQMLVRVADLDGDGRQDIVVGPKGAAKSELAWFSVTSPAGKWTKHTVVGGLTHVSGLDIADFNNDGKPDLHTSLSHERAGEMDNVSIWLSDGAASPKFREQVLSKAGSHRSAVGDVGGDGDIDIVGANWAETDPWLLWENECAPGVLR